MARVELRVATLRGAACRGAWLYAVGVRLSSPRAACGLVLETMRPCPMRFRQSRPGKGASPFTAPEERSERGWGDDVVSQIPGTTTNAGMSTMSRA
jgi:hypothetical protein